ncbi:hypothetical protein ACTFIU_006717 [Dictyostelium citrinum]
MKKKIDNYPISPNEKEKEIGKQSIGVLKLFTIKTIHRNTKRLPQRNYIRCNKNSALLNSLPTISKVIVIRVTLLASLSSFRFSRTRNYIIIDDILNNLKHPQL